MIKKLLTCVLFITLAGASPLASAPKRKGKKATSKKSTEQAKATNTPSAPVLASAGPEDAKALEAPSLEPLPPISRYDEKYQEIAIQLAFESFARLEPYTRKFKPGDIDPNIETLIAFISELFENITHGEPSDTLAYLKANSESLPDDPFTTGTILCKRLEENAAQERVYSKLRATVDAINNICKSDAQGNETTPLKYWLGRCIAIVHGYQCPYNFRVQDPLITESFLAGFYKNPPIKTFILSDDSELAKTPIHEEFAQELDNAYLWGLAVSPITLNAPTSPSLAPSQLEASSAGSSCGAGASADKPRTLTRYNERYQELALNLARKSLGNLEPYTGSFKEGEIDPDIKTIIRCISTLLEKVNPTTPTATLTKLQADIINLPHAPFTALKMLPQYFQENAIDATQFSTQLENAARALSNCYASYTRLNKTSTLSSLLLECTAIIHGYRYYAAGESILTEVGMEPNADLGLLLSRAFLQKFYKEPETEISTINLAGESIKISEEEEYEINNANRWGKLANPTLESESGTSAKKPLSTPHSKYPYHAGLRDGLDHKGTNSEKDDVLERCIQKYTQLIHEYSQKTPTLRGLNEISYYDGYIQGLTKAIQNNWEQHSTKRVLLPAPETLQHNYMKGYFTFQDPGFDPSGIYSTCENAIIRGIALKLALRTVRQKGRVAHRTESETLLYIKIMKKRGTDICFTAEDKAQRQEAVQRAHQIQTELEDLIKREETAASEAEKQSLKRAETNAKRHTLGLERAAKKRAEQAKLIEQYERNKQEQARHNAVLRQAEKARLAELKAQTNALEREKQRAQALQETRPLSEEEMAAHQISDEQFAQILEESRILAQAHKEALDAQKIEEKKERKRLRNARRKLRKAEKNASEEAGEKLRTLKQQRRIERKQTQFEALEKKRAERDYLSLLAKTAQWRMTQNNLILQAVGPVRDYILRECPPAQDYLYRYKLIPEDLVITPYQIGFFDGVTNMFHKLCSYRHALKYNKSEAFDPAPLEMAKARETRELYEMRQSYQEDAHNFSNFAYAQGLEHGYIWLTQERNNLFRKGLALENDGEELSATLAEVGLPHAFACIDGFRDNFSSTTPRDFPKLLKDLLRQTLLDGKKVAKQDKAFDKTIYSCGDDAGAGTSSGDCQ